jgi:hypothetical protein
MPLRRADKIYTRMNLNHTSFQSHGFSPQNPSSNSNSVQIPFRNTTDVRTASVFSERRNTWSPFIYIIYISRTDEPKNIFAPLHLCTSIVDVAICTSIVDAPLSTYANLGAIFYRAICTSIDALELYPSAYADLKESKCVCKESKSIVEMH